MKTTAARPVGGDLSLGQTARAAPGLVAERHETVAAYADDKLTAANSWDRDGKVVADDQLEAVGSRKIRR